MTGNRYHEPWSTELASDYSLPIEEVDAAIDNALDTAAMQDGWNGIPELTDRIWNRIGSDVENDLIQRSRDLIEDMAVTA